ncbi:hypothetical protein E4191_18970 (plasmid) [Paracoccus liaowanqingii]|uniref:Aminoglycoside phosphotransferase domain-containing protein n=1 Tax=Paracoccus liaowanqingii TaxID=2560053 RepID=A0A4Y5STK0_9RHOB|nr:phosphotransferase [Paracoccus liaowanqingii]QDA36208.1 hypothetical protein E4191_18970 [Paracoccus liaowanqingii]
MTMCFCPRGSLAINISSVVPATLHLHPSLQGMVVESVLRNGTRQQVLQVQHKNDTAFLKCFLGTNAAQRREAASMRLRQAGKVMDGENQVVRALVELAECNVLIMSQAPGRPMRDIFLTADAEQRRAIVQRAGEWLGCLITGREKRAVQAWKWYFSLSKFASRYASDPSINTQLLRNHLTLMERTTRQLHHQQVEFGISHGDFHSENIFIAEEGERLILTGIDMEIADPIPVAHDLARMLVWLQSDMTPAPDRKSGIDRTLFDSLCGSHGPISTIERLAIHFHIGKNLLEFYLRRGARLPELRPKMEIAMTYWANCKVNRLTLNVRRDS